MQNVISVKKSSNMIEIESSHIVLIENSIESYIPCTTIGAMKISSLFRVLDFLLNFVSE